MGADFHENAKNGNFISNEKDLFLKVAKEIDILYKCVIFPMERTDNMTAYPKMTAEERKAEYAEVTREYEELKARGLNLNMARGKPGKAQLDLVSDIFSLMQKPEDYVSDGVDVRNYGETQRPARRQAAVRGDSGLPAGAGVRGRQRQPAADVRYDLQGLYPWPAPQRAPLVQGRDREVAVPRSRL